VVLIPKDWGAGAVRRIPAAVYLLGCICCLCMSGVWSWSPARATLLFHTLLVRRWLAAQHAVRAGQGCSNLAKLALGWQQLDGQSLGPALFASLLQDPVEATGRPSQPAQCSQDAAGPVQHEVPDRNCVKEIWGLLSCNKCRSSLVAVSSRQACKSGSIKEVFVAIGWQHRAHRAQEKQKCPDSLGP
jgi:hypothetical protein